MANRCSINYRVFINHNGITDSERHICELLLPAVPPGCAVINAIFVSMYAELLQSMRRQASPPLGNAYYTRAHLPAGRNKEFSRFSRICASVFYARVVCAHVAGRVVDRVVFFEVSPTIARGTL